MDPLEPTARDTDPGEESSAGVRSVSDADLRVGPYELIKTLVDAPGSTFVEARGPTGEQKLLQLAFLRRPMDETEEATERDYIQMMSVATQHLTFDADVQLEQHGAHKRSDGSTTLYWALPWPEEPYRLGHARAHIESVDGLVSVARSLLERMAARHDRGRLEPLLSEHVILVRSRGGADVVGVPIHLPVLGLAEDMVPARLAPEERVAREPGRSGDLWRLGMALRELARGLEVVPPAFDRFIEGLTQPNPQNRLSSAREASLELRALKLDVGEPTWKKPDPMLTPPARRGDPEARTTIFDPGAEATQAGAEFDDEGRAFADHETVAIKIPGAVTDADDSSKTVTSMSLTDDDRRALRSSGRSQPADRLETVRKLGPSPTIAEPKILADKRKRIAQDRGEPESKPRPEPPPRTGPPQRMERRRDRGKPEILAFSDQETSRHLVGADTVVDGRAPPELGSLGEPTEDAHGMIAIQPGRPGSLVLPIESPVDDPAKAVMDALTGEHEMPNFRDTVWDQAKARTAGKPGEARGPKGTVMGLRPLGPQGTVVGVRPLGAQFKIVSMRNLLAAGEGMVPQARSVADAPTGEMVVPSVQPLQQGAIPTEGQPVARDPANTNAGVISYNVPEPQVREVIREVIREVEVSEPWRRYVVDALVVIILAVALAFVFHRFLPTAPKARSGVLHTVTPATEVELDVTPKDAIVVAEDDGRILGQPPLSFLMPPGSEVAVLITAKNYEPQRIVLPERGRVSTELLPLEYRDPCDLDLRVPPKLEIEGVGGTFQADSKYKIPSALILRAANAGAWLVRCPELGGFGSQTLVPRLPRGRITLSVTEPRDAAVYVGSEKIGLAPVETTTTAGFLRVRVGSGESAAVRWVPAFEDTDVRMTKPKI